MESKPGEAEIPHQRDAEGQPSGHLTLRARILLNSIVQFFGRVGSGIGGLILVALLTRYLGPAGYGRYIFVTGFVSLFYVITDLGTGSIAVRQMAQRPESAPGMAGLLFALKLILSAIATVATLATAFAAPGSVFRGPGIFGAILIASIALLFSPAFGSAGVIFQTRLRMEVPAAADVISRVVGLGIVALLATDVLLPRASASTRLQAVVAASTTALLVGGFISFVGARRLVSIVPHLSWAEARTMIRDAAPLAVISVLGIIHYRIDILILSAMRDMGTVGTYGIATKLLDAFVAGAAMFMNVVFPVFSSRAVGQRELLERAFRKALDFMLIVGLGAAVFATVLAPYVVKLLGGSQFRAADQPVMVIAWAIPIIFTSTVLSFMVVAVNQQIRAVPVVLLAILANIVLNIILIPHLGATAPALVTVISEGISACGIGWVMVRHYHFGPDPLSILRIALAAALAGVVAHVALTWGLVPSLAAGGAVYGVALLALRTITLLDLYAILGRRLPS